MLVVVATLFLAEAFIAKEHAALTAGGKPSRCSQTKKLSLLAKSKLDPHCSEGIMSTDMESCCQKDCGECSDESDICNAKATNGRGTTCCPSDMHAGNLPSCENSKAPCAVPDYVRAAPDVSDLMSGEGVRTAIDDCGEAVPDENVVIKLATHFIHFPQQDVSRESATETECGAFGQLGAMGAACDAKDTCMGFTAKEDAEGVYGPDCMLIAGSAVERLNAASHDVYLKVEGLGGRRFLFDPMPYTGECSKSCGGGEITREMKCKSCESKDATNKKCEGLSAPLGMCSGNVAMNEKALLPTTQVCNEYPCDSPCGDAEMFIFHFAEYGSWPSEVTFAIDHGTIAPAEGETATGEEGPCEGNIEGVACCIPGGVSAVDATCLDSYGDDWNGAHLYVKTPTEEGNGTPLCEDFWGWGNDVSHETSVPVEDVVE